MTKSISRKNILKEAGALLIVMVMVLSTIVVARIGNFQSPPIKPNTPSGPTVGNVGIEYIYCTSTTDPDSDDVYYLFDWGDGTNSGWIGPYASGATLCAGHAWSMKGIFCIKVKAKDISGAESDWSDPLCIVITKLQWVPFIPGSEPGSLSEIKLKSSDTMGIMVDSDIPGMYITDVLTNNTLYQKLSIPYVGYTMEIGKPEVPVIRRYLEVPYDVNLSVEIFYSNYTILDGYYIYPAQEALADIENVTSEFVIDNETYSTNEFYPSYNAFVDEPVIIRGHRIISLTIYPVQFNPVTRQIRGYSKIEVRINYESPAQIDGIEERLESEGFEQFLKSFVFNYKSPDKYVTRRDNPPNLSPGADYLIITDDAFETQVQPLANWKEKKGYTTMIVKKSTIPGTGTADDIAAYIQNAYNTWIPAPSYLLLVGDAEYIPTHYKTVHPSPLHGDTKTASDLYYSTVDGNDYFPDIFLGRIPVDTIYQAEIVINKILNYEKNPTSTASYYSTLAVCSYFQDDDDLNTPNYNERDHYEDRRFVLTSEEIRDFLLTKGYTVNRIYYAKSAVTPTNYNNGDYDSGINLPDELLRKNFKWDGFSTQITENITEGRFIINDRDHGNSRNFDYTGYDGWSYPYYNTNYVKALSNGDKLPVVFSMNCLTGWFDGETDPYPDRNYLCLCEEFLLNPNGGAVAAIGSTRISFSGHNDDLCKGFYDAIWPEFDPSIQNGALYKLGQILNYGKAYMFQHPWWGLEKTTFEEFHLFGDPEMEIWTSQPKALTVDHPSKIGSGASQRFVVKVKDGTNPLPDALVCLHKGNDVHTSGYTDADGYIVFDITPSTGGNLDITVTKHNYLPYEGNIVVTSNGAAITISPNSGKVGSSATVTGSNFYNNENVEITLGGQPFASVPATGGNFIVTKNVPSNPLGPTNVIALGDQGRAAITDFYVQESPDPYLYCQWDPSTWWISGGIETWDNPDIVLYNPSGNPVPSNDLKVGTTYKIKATIHNGANVDADNTKVTFSWAKWSSTPTFTNIDTPIYINILGGKTAEASVYWTPTETGHCCLRVEVDHPSDYNLNNNLGQENTDVHPMSPGEISFDVTNPTNTTTLVNLEVTQHGDDEVWAAKIERPYPQILEPGETQTAKLIVNTPEEAKIGETRTFTVTASIDGETIGGVEIRAVKLMDLTKPKVGYLYFYDKPIIPLPSPWTIIIGPITIDVEANDFECGINQVEFYIDNKLQQTVTGPGPFYEWTWERAFFKHTIKVVAYNNCGISDSREIKVWKFY
jgi:hypothetical protein